jgi:hypothetical protein
VLERERARESEFGSRGETRAENRDTADSSRKEEELERERGRESMYAYVEEKRRTEGLESEKDAERQRDKRQRR